MKTLCNKNGSVLVITTAFILFFTMLGLASIHMAGAQNDYAEKRRALDEAFWLADAGIQEALAYRRIGQLISDSRAPRDETYFANNLDLDNHPQGNSRQYDVYSVVDPDCQLCNDRWMAESTANVNGETRTIQAVIAKYDIEDALTTTGEVEGWTIEEDGEVSDTAGSSTINGTADEFAIFDMPSVFNGLTYTDICNQATTKYPGSINCNTGMGGNGQNGYSGTPAAGITIINFTNTPSENFSGGEGLVIVDARQYLATHSGATPTLHINNTTTFSGILWVIGEVTLNGTATINGAVFVEGDANIANGDLHVNYDVTAIENALDHLGSSYTNKPPYIVSWKEI